ncbi:MAG: sulfur carrier protein ThiS [Candidatus Binatus sp.]|uniref:sulfur carrier protein ThiS n=1 Tax=Candidatus Binatus sp. TaxID=2811406 RepID=UPI002718FC52|nr:sulfur carrier protein ThiS [Candidatus Binatus sp.]MDO8434334.1 sulfur carrier protein ThiS [Candidatus Binatus sp.]
MSEKSASAIAITLNGDPYTIEGDPRVAALIERLGIRPTRVAVEINSEIVPKARFAETVISAGDVVEVINFVGGG